MVVNGLYSTLRGMYIQEYLIYICVKVLRIYGSVIKDMSNGIIGRLMRQMLMSGVSGIVVIKSVNQCNAVIESLENNEYSWIG